ncbi:MAG: BolA/IbaG family iron-sulfur metabolism protein [Gammaproteobacteria bacterium]|nr:BolA/IbaG family iron-sulfur metabolism protein [Gammaproteobacteria bacterium]
MIIQTTIEEKLKAAFSYEYLEVVNESFMHNVPKDSESHFKVTLVSKDFDGDRLLARHRKVNKVLAAELDGVIHALALHTLTPDEWFAKAGKVADSPLCEGGGKNQS